MRKIVIGDIHGCSVALNVLLGIIKPQPTDTIITLGDYIDRGPNSKGVIDRLKALGEECNYLPLMGNHELMLMRALEGKDDLASWLYHGGVQTLESFGWNLKSATKDDIKDIIPYEYMRFVMDCLPYHEDDDNIFVHANYEWDAPMDKQTENASFWAHLRDGSIQKAHQSGKTVWVGHTPQPNGMIADHGHVICIDTYAFRPERNGWLTAIDVNTREIWQANELGEIKEKNDGHD